MLYIYLFSLYVCIYIYNTKCGWNRHDHNKAFPPKLTKNSIIFPLNAAIEWTSHHFGIGTWPWHVQNIFPCAWWFIPVITHGDKAPNLMVSVTGKYQILGDLYSSKTISYCIVLLGLTHIIFSLFMNNYHYTSYNCMVLMLVGGFKHFLFSIIYGMSYSQLTFTPSFFRGVGWNHQPECSWFTH